jgi:hypothetical protein
MSGWKLIQHLADIVIQTYVRYKKIIILTEILA